MQSSFLLSVAALLGLAAIAHAQGPVVTLPTLGTIEGRITQTVGNLANTPKDFLNFRNIPFANPVSGSNRFSQPTKLTSSIGTPGAPYDATKSGPICPQLGIDPEELDATMAKTMEEWASDILIEYGLDGIIPPDSLLRILEDFLEVPVEGETLGSLLEILLDENISSDEECLNIAVSTPALPDGSSPLLPVMFFIYGGGFIAGTQYRMGMERLGEVNDVVIVSTNYRLGPLGFMCVDTDDAAGNMGLLDQILALEWVQENIEYFGGDPNQVTIFGESAGSASVSLLTLSPLTDGLFHQAIMESGSAVSPWAYDTFAPDWHAHRIAAKVGCNQADDQAMVDCMKTKDVVEINAAATEYAGEEQRRGTLGFGGTNPCGQTAGVRKVFQHGQDPQHILTSGQYKSIPMFGGANKDEGLIVWAPAYKILNDTMKNDADWVKYDMVEYFLQTSGVDYGWSFTDIITNAYFTQAELGDFNAMQDGIIDMTGVMVLKAPTYKVIEENSKRQNSYFYSLEKRGRKSFYRIFSQTDELPLPTWGNTMAAHADDLLYLFEVPLPLYLCDLNEFFAALNVAWDDCVASVGFLGAESCVTDPAGPFKAEWMECIDGHLTPDEEIVSDAMVKAFSNFAVYGNPTPAGSGLPTLPAWSNDDPKYIIFDTTVALGTDYRATWETKDQK